MENKKTILKYKHQGEKGLLHYTLLNDEIVVLSQFDSLKVKHIQDHGAFHVSFDLKSDRYDVLAADIITDKEVVEAVYDLMQETGNSYFNDGIEGLCVLKLHK